MEDIIVFGKGWYFEQKRKTMEKEYRIIAFLDNAAEVSGSREDSVPTYLPEAVLELPKVPIVIMSCVHFIEMWRQLSELFKGGHLEESRIRFGMNCAPCYDCTEEVMNQQHGRILSKNGRLMYSDDKGDYLFDNMQEYNRIMDSLVRDNLSVDWIQKLPMTPYSRRFGRERGTPVDRYYIEKFLEDNKEKIRGNVMEIGDNSYTKRFGEHVEHSYILHVLGLGENVIKGDLVSGEGIQDEFLDCFICTQTIQTIFDLDSTVKNMYRSLKMGGCALVTMHGISQLSMADYSRWGEYWRFTKKSAKLLFERYFDEVEVFSYGNVKTATAFLYGLCQEDLVKSDFRYDDEQYQLIIAVRGVKKSRDE